MAEKEKERVEASASQGLRNVPEVRDHEYYRGYIAALKSVDDRLAADIATWEKAVKDAATIPIERIQERKKLLREACSRLLESAEERAAWYKNHAARAQNGMHTYYTDEYEWDLEFPQAGKTVEEMRWFMQGTAYRGVYGFLDNGAGGMLGFIQNVREALEEEKKALVKNIPITPREHDERVKHYEDQRMYAQMVSGTLGFIPKVGWVIMATGQVVVAWDDIHNPARDGLTWEDNGVGAAMLVAGGVTRATSGAWTGHTLRNVTQTAIDVKDLGIGVYDPFLNAYDDKYGTIKWFVTHQEKLQEGLDALIAKYRAPNNEAIAEAEKAYNAAENLVKEAMEKLGHAARKKEYQDALAKWPAIQKAYDKQRAESTQKLNSGTLDAEGVKAEKEKFTVVAAQKEEYVKLLNEAQAKLNEINIKIEPLYKKMNKRLAALKKVQEEVIPIPIHELYTMLEIYGNHFNHSGSDGEARQVRLAMNMAENMLGSKIPVSETETIDKIIFAKDGRRVRTWDVLNANDLSVLNESADIVETTPRVAKDKKEVALKKETTMAAAENVPMATKQARQEEEKQISESGIKATSKAAKIIADHKGTPVVIPVSQLIDGLEKRLPGWEKNMPQWGVWADREMAQPDKAPHGFLSNVQRLFWPHVPKDYKKPKNFWALPLDVQRYLLMKEAQKVLQDPQYQYPDKNGKMQTMARIEADDCTAMFYPSWMLGAKTYIVDPSDPAKQMAVGTIVTPEDLFHHFIGKDAEQIYVVTGHQEFKDEYGQTYSIPIGEWVYKTRETGTLEREMGITFDEKGYYTIKTPQTTEKIPKVEEPKGTIGWADVSPLARNKIMGHDPGKTSKDLGFSIEDFLAHLNDNYSDLGEDIVGLLRRYNIRAGQIILDKQSIDLLNLLDKTSMPLDDLYRVLEKSEEKPDRYAGALANMLREYKRLGAGAEMDALLATRQFSWDGGAATQQRKLIGDFLRDPEIFNSPVFDAPPLTKVSKLVPASMMAEVEKKKMEKPFAGTTSISLSSSAAMAPTFPASGGKTMNKTQDNVR